MDTGRCKKHNMLEGTCSVCDYVGAESSREMLRECFEEVKLENNNNEEEVVEKRICPEPDCELGDDPQPAFRFEIHKSSGLPIGSCGRCRQNKPEEIETKVCKEPDCVVGEPQPIEQFGLHSRWKTRIHTCRSCMDNKRSARQQKRKAKPKAPDTPAQEKPPVTNSNLTIDFSNHTDLLTELKKLAKEQLRTVENQALWMLAAVQKHGEKLEK